MSLLLCALTISAFSVLVTLNFAQTDAINNAIQTSVQVYSELSAAEKAGANITSISAEYNNALNLIDRAQRLENSGDTQDATSLATQAISIFQTISPSAETITAEASSHQSLARLERIVLVPMGAIFLALVGVALYLIHKHTRFKQIREMGLAVK